MIERVVSNVAPTIVGFIETLPRFTQKINMVYEESLDYPAALKKWIDENRDAPFEQTYPLFIYRRSVLRHTEMGMGRRLVNRRIQGLTSGPGAEMFSGIFGEMDIDFVVVNPDMNELENFEISYLSEAGQATEKKFFYEVPTLGRLDYFVSYGLLEEKSIVTDQMHYKSLSSSATIRGFFFSADGTSAVIQQIKLSLLNMDTSDLISTHIITP